MEKIGREQFLALKQGQPLLRMRVVTGSMEPLIQVGAVVVVDTETPLRRWDVVVFWDGTLMICHVLWHLNRLVTDAGEELMVTCPLDGKGLDLSVPRAQMLGRVMNYRLSVWQRWRLSWRRRRKA